VIRGPLRAPPSTPRFAAPAGPHFTTRVRSWGARVRIFSGAPLPNKNWALLPEQCERPISNPSQLRGV